MNVKCAMTLGNHLGSSSRRASPFKGPSVLLIILIITIRKTFYMLYIFILEFEFR